MPDLESRLPEMLRRAATGSAPDPSLERRVLRHSRRRRLLNASAAGLAAIALVAGTVIGAQGVLRADRTAPGDESHTPSSSPSPVPTGPIGPSVKLPSAVLTTRDAIVEAADARDFDALEALIDPNRFAYNFSDGSNPVPEWRTDPAPLDTLATLLQMPPTTNRDVYPDLDPASPTVYIWPALMASDLENLTPEDRAMLDALGITARDVRSMLDGFGSYVGPRAGIAEDGTWTFFTTGGD